MAMDRSALLELLEALKAAGVDERVRITPINRQYLTSAWS